MIDTAGRRALTDVYEREFAPRRSVATSQHTRNQYVWTIRDFGLFLGRPATLDDLQDDTATAFLGWLLANKSGNGRTRCNRTVNNRRCYLLSFWRWCERKRLVDNGPDVEPLPEPTKVPRAYTIGAMQRLFAQFESTPGYICGVRASGWWKSLYLAAWSTGERTSALMATRFSDLDLDTGELLIPAERRKGKCKEMLYHLLPDALAAIEAIREPQREKVWPWPFVFATFFLHTRRIHDRAGLPRGGIQKMRRSFASHLEANGGNATEALAHSSRSTTIKSYLDPSIIQREPENRKLPKLA